MQENPKLFEKSTLKTRKMHRKDIYKNTFSYEDGYFKSFCSDAKIEGVLYIFILSILGAAGGR